MLEEKRQELYDGEAPSSPVADNAGPRPVPGRALNMIVPL